MLRRPESGDVTRPPRRKVYKAQYRGGNANAGTPHANGAVDMQMNHACQTECPIGDLCFLFRREDGGLARQDVCERGSEKEGASEKRLAEPVFPYGWKQWLVLPHEGVLRCQKEIFQPDEYIVHGRSNFMDLYKGTHSNDVRIILSIKGMLRCENACMHPFLTVRYEPRVCAVKVKMKVV